MIVGLQKDFAIEWELVKDLRSQIFLRFWINGIPVGDYENQTILHMLCENLRYFLGLKTKRDEYPTKGESKDILFYDVWELLYGKGTLQSDLDKKFSNYDFYQKVTLIRDLYILGEVSTPTFMDSMVLMFFYDSKLNVDRLIWRYNQETTIYDASLKRGLVYEVIERFLEETS